LDVSNFGKRIELSLVVCMILGVSLSAEKLVFDSVMKANTFISDTTGIIGDTADIMEVLDNKAIGDISKITLELSKKIDKSNFVRNIAEVGIENKKIKNVQKGLQTLTKRVDTLNDNILKMNLEKQRLNKLAKKIPNMTPKFNKVAKVAGKVGKASYMVDMSAKTGVIVGQYLDGTLTLKDSLNYVLDASSVIDKFHIIEGARYVEKTYEAILEKKSEIRNINTKYINELEQAIDYLADHGVKNRLNGQFKEELSKADSSNKVLETIEKAQAKNDESLKLYYNLLTQVSSQIQKPKTRAQEYTDLLTKKVDSEADKAMLNRVNTLQKQIIQKLDFEKDKDSTLLYVEDAMKVKVIYANTIIKDNINKQINEYEQIAPQLSKINTVIKNNGWEKLVKAEIVDNDENKNLSILIGDNEEGNELEPIEETNPNIANKKEQVKEALLDLENKKRNSDNKMSSKQSLVNLKKQELNNAKNKFSTMSKYTYKTNYNRVKTVNTKKLIALLNARRIVKKYGNTPLSEWSRKDLKSMLTYATQLNIKDKGRINPTLLYRQIKIGNFKYLKDTYATSYNNKSTTTKIYNREYGNLESLIKQLESNIKKINQELTTLKLNNNDLNFSINNINDDINDDIKKVIASEAKNQTDTTVGDKDSSLPDYTTHYWQGTYTGNYYTENNEGELVISGYTDSYSRTKENKPDKNVKLYLNENGHSDNFPDNKWANAPVRKEITLNQTSSAYFGNYEYTAWGTWSDPTASNTANQKVYTSH